MMRTNNTINRLMSDTKSHLGCRSQINHIPYRNVPKKVPEQCIAGILLSLPCPNQDSTCATLARCINQAPLNSTAGVSQKQQAILLNGKVLKGMQFSIQRVWLFTFSFLKDQNSIFWYILYVVIYRKSNSWAPAASKIRGVWKVFCTSCFPSYRGRKYNEAGGRKLFCTL